MERRGTVKFEWYKEFNGRCCSGFEGPDEIRSHIIENHGLNNDQIERALRAFVTEGKKSVFPEDIIKKAREVEGWSDLELDKTEEEITKFLVPSGYNQHTEFESRHIKAGLLKLKKDRDVGREVTYPNIIWAAGEVWGRVKVHTAPPLEKLTNFIRGKKREKSAGPSGIDTSGAGPSPSTSTGTDSESPQSSEQRRPSSLPPTGSRTPYSPPLSLNPALESSAGPSSSNIPNPDPRPSTSQAFVRRDSLKNRNTRGRSSTSNPSGNTASRPTGLPIGPRSKAPVPPEAPSTSDAPGPSGTHNSAPFEAPSTSDEPTSSEAPGSSEPSSSSTDRKETNNQ